MKISIITPNYHGAATLDETLRSVIAQREDGIDLEYIVVDGASRDGSADIIARYRGDLQQVVSEPDRGPQDAINKGLRLATGDVVGWLNSDDLYHPGALRRAIEAMTHHPRRALCFGPCRIIDPQGQEIRRGITRFKECFHPISCRPVIQTINYISQPAMWFRRSALGQVGPLREDLVAAWDYEFMLRLWRVGGAVRIGRPWMADFRWHPGTISGRTFRRQFQEEYEAARADAGRFAPQTLAHWCVRWGIVGAYTLMTRPGGEAG